MRKALAFLLCVCSFNFTVCAQGANYGDDKQTLKGGTMLVVYFSCTGTTQKIAEYAAEIPGADLFEIKPEVPYTQADLNYSNSSSRATREQKDTKARPAIANHVENMAQYDTILLGYPIWWGEAPKIIYTFLESYDFSGKTIVPFCTSGSSGVGSSATNLHALCSRSAKWLPGKRFGSGVSKADVKKWIDGLGL